MTPQQIVIDALLTLAALVALGSVVGLVAARDDLDRLHFLAPASVASPVLVAAAVVAREAFDGRAVKALLVAGLFLVLNRDPLSQAVVFAFFGGSLVVVFIVLQAPDVSLSAIVVGAMAYPLMTVLTLAKARGRSR